MADIFISYARTDAARVERLVRLLETRWSVFWDRTIPPGQTWDNYIGKQLEDSRCVLVIWSAKAVASEWVREEAHHGRDRGALVPVMFDKVSPPFGFRQVQAADLTAWDGVTRDHAVELLMTTLEGLLPSTTTERATVTASAAPPVPSPTPPRQSVEPVSTPPPPEREKPSGSPHPPEAGQPHLVDGTAPPLGLGGDSDGESPGSGSSIPHAVAPPTLKDRSTSPGSRSAFAETITVASRPAVRENQPRAFEKASPEPGSPFLRSRMAFVAGAGALLVVIAIGIWATKFAPEDYDRVGVVKGDAYTDLTHVGRVESLAFSADGRTLAASIASSGIRLWHLDDLARDPTLIGNIGSGEVAFSPSQPLLAIVSGDVTLRRLTDPETPITIPESGGAAGGTFSADGTLFGAAGGQVLGVWRIGDGKEPEVVSVHRRTGNGSYLATAFSPDGRWLAAASDDANGMMHLWRTSELDKDPIALGASGVTAWDAEFSRDSRVLAVAADDGLYVWESLEGEPRVLTKDETWSVEFSPDGQLMAVGDRAGAVTLWRVGDMRATSKQYLDGRVDSLAFSPDGRTLAAGSFEGTVRLWTLP